jgi:hypothetical protein
VTVLTHLNQRIRAILARRNKQRQQRAMALAQKEAEGDYSHLKGGKKGGGMDGAALPLPTLPNVMLDDDEIDDGASLRTRGPAASNYPASTYTAGEYYADPKQVPGQGYDYTNDYPAMPGYDQHQSHGYYNQQQYQHPAANPVYAEREPYFQDQYGSVATLPQQPGGYDQRQAYSQYAPSRPDYSRAEPEPSTAGLAYDTQDYPSPGSVGPPARATHHQQQSSQYGGSAAHGGQTRYSNGNGPGYAQ